MSSARKASKKIDEEKDDEENPTDLGPGVTESYEEV